jgi:hypothetical protein
MSSTGAFNWTGCWQAAVPSVLRSLPADGLIESSPKAVHGASRLACTTGINPRCSLFSSEIPSLGLCVPT